MATAAMIAARGRSIRSTTAWTPMRTVFATVAMIASTAMATAWATEPWATRAASIRRRTRTMETARSAQTRTVTAATTVPSRRLIPPTTAWTPTGTASARWATATTTSRSAQPSAPTSTTTATATDTDCDDAVPTCALDCTTNSDGDPQVDCFETFCGTNPTSSGSDVSWRAAKSSYETALDSANGTVGHDYIVLGDFTMTQDAPKLDDDAGRHHSAARGRDSDGQLRRRSPGLRSRAGTTT